MWRYAAGAALAAFALSTYAEQIFYWEISNARLAKVGYSVSLKNKDGQTVATFPSSQLKKLVDVKDRIGREAGLIDVTLGLSSDEKPNAFAGSKDGKRFIVFTFGMLRLVGEDEEMMASVMGHEFGHHVKNHQGRSERQTMAQAAGVLAQIVAGLTIGNPVAADLAGRAGGMAAAGAIHSYDRDQEREADTFGVEVMAKAGYDPQGAVRYWNLAMRKTNNGGFFSTHPASEERLENVHQLALTHPKAIVVSPTPSEQAKILVPPAISTKNDTSNAEVAVNGSAPMPSITYHRPPVLALAAARSAMIKYPADSDSWATLARAYAEEHQYLDAYRAVYEALRLQPESLTALYEQGRINYLTGAANEVRAIYLKLSERDATLANEYFSEFLLPKAANRK